MNSPPHKVIRQIWLEARSHTNRVSTGRSHQSQRCLFNPLQFSIDHAINVEGMFWSLLYTWFIYISRHSSACSRWYGSKKLVENASMLQDAKIIRERTFFTLGIWSWSIAIAVCKIPLEFDMTVDDVGDVVQIHKTAWAPPRIIAGHEKSSCNYQWMKVILFFGVVVHRRNLGLVVKLN